jgi:Tol biopolymer transport system component
MKLIHVFTVLSCINLHTACAQENKTEASKYLGEKEPGITPQLFSPGLVSRNDRYEYGSTFAPDNNEFYFAVNVGQKPEIHVIRFQNSTWTKPELLIGHSEYGYNDPFATPDGKRLFFISDRAMDGKGSKKDIDIWYVERNQSGWSAPVNAGKEINSAKNEYYMSFTKNGKMYFSSNGSTSKETDKNYDIKTSEFQNGNFQPSVTLGPAINSNHYEADVFVDPDERYVIFCSERPGGKGKGDLYISFRNSNGEWQPAKILDAGISTEAYEFCPFVSNDGKYFFFSRSGDIYWVSAQILNRFK